MLQAIRKIEKDLDNIRGALIWAPNHGIDLLNYEVATVLLIFFELKSWYLEGEEVLGLLEKGLRENLLRFETTKGEGEANFPRIRWLTFNIHYCYLLYRCGDLQATEANLTHALSQLSKQEPEERRLIGMCLWILASLKINLTKY